MHIKPSPFRLAPLAVASMVLIWSAGAAHAAPVLGAVSDASADGSLATPSVFSSPSYVNSSSFIANLGGTGSGSAFAAGSGAYAVSSGATGIATGTANASFASTFTNDSGVEQFYTLNFFIYGGSISTTLFGSAVLSDGEFLRAGYGASIKFNGNTVFSSAAELLRDDVNSTPPLTTSGTALNGGTLSGGTYFWDSATYSVSLGLVAAGATFNILAEVLDYAEADVGVYDFTGGGGYCGDGYGGPSNAIQRNEGLAGQAISCFKGTANAFYGDPLDLGASTPGPIGQFQLIANDVPEPGSLGLVAGALGAGLLAMRRRRRDGPDQG